MGSLFRSPYAKASTTIFSFYIVIILSKTKNLIILKFLLFICFVRQTRKPLQLCWKPYSIVFARTQCGLPFLSFELCLQLNISMRALYAFLDCLVLCVCEWSCNFLKSPC